MNTEVIRVRNLQFSYPDGCRALKAIDFVLHKGDTVALIGPNGAGKSTFILHLNGVLRGEGMISVLGEELDRNNVHRIRSRVGVVFQDPNDQLFMSTVFDDIAFGPLNFGIPPKEVKSRVDKILAEMGLKKVSMKSPHHLSLGEMKNASLATVLVLEPEILILDEPTSNLDPGSRRKFIQLLNRLPISKIIATHDLDMVVECCSKVVLMNDGLIITQGDTKKILNNKKLLEQHNLEIPASILLEKKSQQ
jgi:cobalt/nickel transport system ATP-binding protein